MMNSQKYKTRQQQKSAQWFRTLPRVLTRAETCLVAGATDHYHSRADTVAVPAGWERAGATLSYNTLFQVQSRNNTLLD